MDTITPVFIFSLPRSGSTLLQQMLASHDQISSAAEPWILLPLAGLTHTRNLDVFANYSNFHTLDAIGQFLNKFPEKEISFFDEIRSFVERLYSLAASPDATFFVDKTPRYYLIIDFIAQLFPDAKFIFLFRNPLDILSSIVTTWGKGKLHITHWAIDLYRGPFCLQEGIEKYRDRAIAVYYDDLVRSPKISLQAICEYIGVEFSEDMISNWKNNRFEGNMGDRKIKYKSAIETSSLEQWKQILNTHLRKRYASWYIRYLGNDVLNLFGCDMLELQKDLKGIACSWKNTVSDALELSSATLGRFISIKVLKNQMRRGIWKSELLG